MDSDEQKEPEDRPSNAEQPRKTVGESAKQHAPLAISFVALLLSSTTLYLTQLRDAVLTLTSADALWVRYQGNESSGNFEIHTTLVFQNLGPQPGVVRKVALQVASPRSARSVLLEAAYFERLGSDFHFVPELIAGPVAVGAKSTVDRQINFITPRDDASHHPFPEAGDYDVTILFWDGDGDAPKTGESFGVQITESETNHWNQRASGQAQVALKLVPSHWAKWQAGRR